MDFTNYFIEKGNVTTYEWKYGEPPLKVELPELKYDFETEEPINLDLDDDGIDFGDIGGSGDNCELETGMHMY